MLPSDARRSDPDPGTLASDRVDPETGDRHRTGPGAVGQGIERERRFAEALIDSLEDGLVVCDAGGVITLAKLPSGAGPSRPIELPPPDTWVSTFQLERADGSPMTLDEVPIYRALRGDQLRGVELSYSSDGVRRTVSVNGQPVLDDAGRTLGAVVTIHDVTEERSARLRSSGPAAETGLAAEKTLRAALDNGELTVFYQPEIAIDTERITGVEALVRWNQPGRGVVGPSEFIPLAERSGLIVPLGSHVLERACRDAARWQRRFRDRPPLFVSVNVSARQFEPGLVETVRRALETTGLDPGTLSLELTESILMADVESAADTLSSLKDLGVQISIDDFGTGYSSLAYLRRFPLDFLKIDRSFVDGLGRDPEDTAIVAAVVAMAHALELSVVAEGVETPEQLEALRTLGCEFAQGYYFARPEPADVIEQLLVRDQPGVGLAREGQLDGAAARGAAYRPDTVVIADDAEDVLQLARMSLAAAGFEVHEARTGAEAVELARRVRPETVVLDVNMPDMNGFEVCSALRADHETSDCTILMLTATALAADKIEAYSVGADDYLIKPFSPRELVGRVRAAVRRRRESGGYASDASAPRRANSG